MGVLGAVVVPANSPARELPDLRGKKVGLIPGATTTQDMNASSRVVYNLDLLQNTEAIHANSPPDLGNLARSGNVDAVLVWEPSTAILTRSGDFRMLIHQQDLWERATGSKETEVHVVYLTTPALAEQCADLLGDINAAQKEAHDIWYNRKDVAVRILADYNKLTPDDAEFAMGQTRQVLYGLTDANVETILAQLKHNREHGTLLKSDVWNNPAQVKQEMFFIPPTRN
jgi:ABC-type nitrate/sulfonate/bicarbonate transport system substrate-binding protein